MSIKQPFLVLFSILSLVMFSCGEKDESTLLEEDDSYVKEATDLANDYLDNSGVARSSRKIAVTVLQFYEGSLYYATNTDDIRGYQPVGPHTITAHVEPGEYIFWFTGRGVSHLDGIEFDEVSQYVLGNNPSEAYPARLWLVKIPEDIKVDENNELKYDILYSPRGYNENPIRLDPKLQIKQ